MEMNSDPVSTHAESYTAWGISHLGKTELGKQLNPASIGDWRILGGYLEFSDVEIQNYECRNGVVKDYSPTVCLLRDWEKRFENGPDIEHLRYVLSLMGRLDVIGTIDRMMKDKKFLDVPWLAQASKQDVFGSDLGGKDDSRRDPVENSFCSQDSAKVAHMETEGLSSPYQHLKSNPPMPSVRPKIKMHGGAIHPISQNVQFTAISPPKQQTPVNIQASSGPPARKVCVGHPNPVVTPRSVLTKQNKEAQDCRQKATSDQLSNLKSTNSWEQINLPSSSWGSFNSNTWPTGKENPFKDTVSHGNLYKATESSNNTCDCLPLHGIPGDYQFQQRQWCSCPIDCKQGNNRMRFAADDNRQPRQVQSGQGNISHVSRGVTPMPYICRSGFAFGITFGWKNWRSGMDLAKKLKQEGHHVEVDRKTCWYLNRQDRDCKITSVFNSCTYIIVIYTPEYETEVSGQIPSQINTKFIFQYMQKEFERNNRQNKRFIPIVDVSRISHTPDMFKSYPLNIHRYIVQVIRQEGIQCQPGVIVERQFSLN